MAEVSTVLVTGAAGFVGRRVVAELAAAGWAVRAVVRRRPADPPPTGAEWLPLGDLAEVEDWSHALAGIDAVVHLAGRAHVMDDRSVDPLADYRRTNVEATLKLAHAAAAAGVRRFVFMSSVKAVAESSSALGLGDDAVPSPEDAYGVSKREAELALLVQGAFGTMSVVVLRPPLVYGPGVRANFARLVNAVARGLPLPLGAVDNRRSLVYVGNLSSAVRFALDSPALAGHAAFVTDGEDLSTPDLIRRIALALGRTPRLLPVPVGLFRLMLTLVGKAAVARRLLGSLRLRMERLPAAGWKPPYTPTEGIAATVAGWHPEEVR